MNCVVEWKDFRFCYIQSAKVSNTIDFCVRDARDSNEPLCTEVEVVGLSYLISLNCLVVCTEEVSTIGEIGAGINTLCSGDMLGSCTKIR